MSKSGSLAVMLLFWPMALRAQETLPTLPEVMAQVQDAKVYLVGFIGRGPEGVPRFVLPGGKEYGFPVEFKSDTDLDAKIEGCGFDGSGGLPCKVAAYGYLNWDVPRVQVVITSIESIEPPLPQE